MNRLQGAVLREAYRDTLPTSVLDRKKHGFGVPVSSWWSGPLRPLVDDLLKSPKADIHALLNRPVVEKIVKDHQEGKRDHGQRIFLLVQLELWLRSLRTQQQAELKPSPPSPSHNVALR